MDAAIAAPPSAQPANEARLGGFWGRLRIGWKIGLGFGVSLALAAVMIALGASRLQQIAGGYAHLLAVNYVLVDRAGDLELAVEQQAAAVRGFVMAQGDEALLEPAFTNAQQRYKESANDLRRLLGDDEGRAIFVEVEGLADRNLAASQQAIAAARGGRLTEATRLIRVEGASLKEMTAQRSRDLAAFEHQVMADEVARLTAFTATTLTQLLVVTALGGVLAVINGFVVTGMLTRQVGAVAEAARRLVSGDLTARAAVRSNDEIGQMARGFNHLAEQQQAALESERAAKAYLEAKVGDYVAFVTEVARGDLSRQVAVTGNDQLGLLGHNLNTMTSSLRELTQQSRSAVASLSSSTAEIVASVAQQSSGAAEQAAAIAQTTATVNEVKASADQAVQMATVVGDTASQAQRAAAEGVAVVRTATDSMADIRQRVQSIAENILALSEQSQQISEIIAAVNDLADQSNLLALNAAIEASRAGEQGKGFAVVATEIRSLAEQSKTATAQVRTILSDIQRATNAAVMATEQGTKGVDAGQALIGQAGETIDELAEVIQQAAQAAQQIGASVRQHSVGMEQIAAAMGNINQASAQNVAAASSTQQAAESLTDLAGRLNRLTAQYQL
ncbi:MAG: methyl-accepting chemotaxis protein [Chloroflexi bacterium]|nr:methyl-accepting chemotaxis protein [Chloroflexota bacterium]